jgi:hypothetical protein
MVEANEQQFFVELKADRRLKLPDPDAVICQTPCDPIFNSDLARQGRVFWVHNWLQNNLIPRDAGRRGIAAAYFLGNRSNLLTGRDVVELGAGLQEIGVHLCTPERPDWNDYSHSDVVIAVRRAELLADDIPPPFSVSVKPAAKLINAWHAGVPAVVSREPAYERLRRSELDYIRASNVDQIIGAVRRLQADPQLYAAMVRNGAERAKEFTLTKIRQSWIDVLRDGILPLAREKFGVRQS